MQNMDGSVEYQDNATVIRPAVDPEPSARRSPAAIMRVNFMLGQRRYYTTGKQEAYIPEKHQHVFKGKLTKVRGRYVHGVYHIVYRSCTGCTERTPVTIIYGGTS
jgi:hypothetical protein